MSVHPRDMAEAASWGWSSAEIQYFFDYRDLHTSDCVCWKCRVQAEKIRLDEQNRVRVTCPRCKDTFWHRGGSSSERCPKYCPSCGRKYTVSLGRGDYMSSGVRIR